MLAGTSEAKITPPVGAPLLGCIQRSNGVHDDLFARALVLSDGATRAVIASLDLIGLDFSLADEIRSSIQHRTGIATTFLNCTHTHSAPFTIPWSVLGWRWLDGPGREWRKRVIATITDAVDQAARRLGEVQLRAGRSRVQIGFNRRLPTGCGVVMKPNPEGTVVPWVDVLSVEAPDGTPRAVLFSHAAHPVIVHGASRLISADYPGYATATVKHHFGANTLAMFGQACGANINGEPLRGGFEAAERAGVALGEAAVAAVSGGQRLHGSALRITGKTLALPFQDLPSRETCEVAIRNAEERLHEALGKSTATDDELWSLQDQAHSVAASHSKNSVDDVQPMGRQPWWIEDTVLCLRKLVDKVAHVDRRPLRFEVQALSLGDEWCLLATTHELFAEYQLWLDQTAPFQKTMALAYTNGCESYVPTDDAFPMGGYEAASFPADGASLRYPYRIALRPGIEQQIKDGISALWS